METYKPLMDVPQFPPLSYNSLIVYPSLPGDTQWNKRAAKQLTLSFPRPFGARAAVAFVPSSRAVLASVLPGWKRPATWGGGRGKARPTSPQQLRRLRQSRQDEPRRGGKERGRGLYSLRSPSPVAVSQFVYITT